MIRVLALAVALAGVAGADPARAPGTPIDVDAACGFLDPRVQSREALHQAFADCLAGVRSRSERLLDALPGLARQHQTLLRLHLSARDRAGALQVHGMAMDFFDAVMARPDSLLAESTRAAVLLCEYLGISQGLRLAMVAGETGYQEVHHEALARPLAVITRMLDARTTLTQRFRDRFLQFQGSMEGPRGRNRFGLPVEGDPVEMLLEAIGDQVGAYLAEGQEHPAGSLLAAVRFRLDSQGSSRKRYRVRVERELDRLEARIRSAGKTTGR